MCRLLDHKQVVGGMPTGAICMQPPSLFHTFHKINDDIHFNIPFQGNYISAVLPNSNFSFTVIIDFGNIFPIM